MKRSLLAITPSTGRIGFAYFEDEQLIEWGMKMIGSTRADYATAALRTISALARSFEPDLALVPPLSDQHRNTLRGRIIRVSRLVLAESVSSIVDCPDGDVHKYFQAMLDVKRPTKHMIMFALVEKFSALEVFLPRPRRTGESQDYWTPMFDAAARGVVWLNSSNEK